jgi:hypothetical protein
MTHNCLDRPGTRAESSPDEGFLAAVSRPGPLLRTPWNGLAFAACLIALTTGQASPALAQASIDVSARVISLEPITQGLAQASSLASIPASALGWIGPVRTETRLAVVTRQAAVRRSSPVRVRAFLVGFLDPSIRSMFQHQGLSQPATTSTAEPVAITIAFLRN